MPSSIESVPLDILVDSLIPYLPLKSLVSLSQTCKSLNELINSPTSSSSSDLIWRRLISRDLNFPVNNTARTTGWKNLYRKVSRPLFYLWGSEQNGRMALDSEDRRRRERFVKGNGVPEPMLLRGFRKANLVDVVAGGWSFHALDSSGKIWFWGSMNGDFFSHSSDLGAKGTIINVPTLLPVYDPPTPEETWTEELPPLQELSCGRSHATGLSKFSSPPAVYEWRDWARIFRVEDALGRWGGGVDEPHSESIVQVDCGWAFSSVLTKSGGIFVWWDGSYRPSASDREEVYERARSEKKLTVRAKVDSLQLPPLPLGEVEGGVDGDGIMDEVTKIAAGDEFVVALTKGGRLFKFDIGPVGDVLNRGEPDEEDEHEGGEQGTESTSERIRQMEDNLRRIASGRINTSTVARGDRVDPGWKWKYLKKFSDMSEIAKLEQFVSQPTKESEDVDSKKKERDDPLPPPSSSLKVTHVSAHFQSFAAYAVPPSSSESSVSGTTGEGPKATESLVLLGNDGTGRDGPSELAEPEIVRELQNKGVIKVTLGDYHYGALTSSGELFTWGSYSDGALGQGEYNEKLEARKKKLQDRVNELSGKPPSEPGSSSGVTRSQGPRDIFRELTGQPPLTEGEREQAEVEDQGPPPPIPQFRGGRRFDRGGIWRGVGRRMPVRPAPEPVRVPARVTFDQREEEDYREFLVARLAGAAAGGEGGKGGDVREGAEVFPERADKNRRFVFNASFAGWHSSALVVNLDDEDDVKDVEEDEGDKKEEEEYDAEQEREEREQRERQSGGSEGGSQEGGQRLGGGEGDGEGAGGAVTVPIVGVPVNRGAGVHYRVGYPGRGMRGGVGSTR